MRMPVLKALAGMISDNPLQGAVAIHAATVFAFLATKDYFPEVVQVGLPFVLVAICLIREPTARFGLLGVVLAALVATVVVNFHSVANHGFMLAYTAAVLLLAAAQPPGRDMEMLGRLAAQLLMLLMGVALLQKLSSAHYMRGDLVGTLLVEGEAFRNLISLFRPDWPAEVEAARAAARKLMASPAPGSIAMAVPPTVATLAVLLTWAALAAQFGLEALLLLRRRIGVWLHVGLLGFVAVIYATRPENVFLSVNCFLGFCMTDAQSRGIRVWYVLAVIYLLSTEITGYRPWILS